MLTGMLAHTESARVIGRAYLNTHPNLADREILEGMLRDPSTRVPRRVDPPDLHSRIIAQVRTDYEFGRVVILNGWILSDTEAKLCALLSLP